jgi:mannose-6-phosphate isomerase-like protein (cupin superfamily)
MSSSHENRPWGSFDVLIDASNTKVKRLSVNPGQRLSLQSHKLRDEHWVVVAGTAVVTLDDETLELGYGQSVYVKRGARHRIANQGDKQLEIIEVQTGDGFPEEDIVRYSDDYHRAD